MARRVVENEIAVRGHRVETWLGGEQASVGGRQVFAKRYADLGSEVARAARTFAEEVANGSYPDPEHSYDWAIKH